MTSAPPHAWLDNDTRVQNGQCRTQPIEGDVVSTPDHVENTGDNLRHAAEVQEQARDAETQVPSEQPESVNPLPDFNT